MSRGKILKIKQGYNPNSSSIGTALIAFPCVLFLIFFLFSLIVPLIIAKKIKKIMLSKKSEKDNRQ